MLKKINKELIESQFVKKTDEIIAIKELLYKNSESNHIVSISNDTYYTWQDLRTYCNHLVRKLEDEYHMHTDVALVFESGFLMVCAILALLHCQRKIILPSLQTSEYLSDIDDKYSLLLTDKPDLKKIGSSILICHLHDISLVSKLHFDFFLDKRVTDRADILLFTSGSTGTPKVIEKYCYLFDRQIKIEHRLFAQKLCGAVMYSSVNHNHLLGLMYRLLFPLALRMPFADKSLLMPEQMALIDTEYVMISSPAFLRFLDERVSLPKARVVFSSGGKIPIAVGQRVEHFLSCRVLEFYGSSETGAIAYKHFLENHWNLLEGIQYRQGENQCLSISSPLLPTKEWYQMEDRIVLTEMGFELIGRADRIVKIADKRVSLTQIEKLLLQLPEIDEVKILVIKDHLREYIGAVISLTQEHKDIVKKVLLQKMRTHLHNRIELVALPRKIRIVPFMPLNEQGKLNLKQLESLFE